MARQGQVTINLFNTLGEHVAEIANDIFSRGYNEVTFEKGSLKSGIYIYVLESDEGTFRQQLMIK